MSRRTRPILLAIALGIALGAAHGAHAQIVNTLHNLTPSGPGTVKNPDPVGLCRFCHAPHGAGQTTALWNRELPTAIYDLYGSSTLEATVNQPTGASRLCLSCHDGTIALGDVVNPGPDPVAPLGPLTGRVLLETDLSDDHPVSFVYDDALAARNGELVSPAALNGPVRLDATGQVQCTSCHDPHSDRFPKFLVEDDADGTLCLACHAKRGWPSASHATSQAIWNGAGTDPWPETDFVTVAQNACLSCHDPHSAAEPVRLLRGDSETLCLVCHNGNVAQKDVEAQLLKISAHPIPLTLDIHDPAEDLLTMDRHVACMDCHNPHAATQAVTAVPPEVPGPQLHVRGVDLGGMPVADSEFAYQICFKCHGLAEAPTPRVVRQDHVTNVRLEVNSANPSFHPVVDVGTNPLVQTLIAPLTPQSLIYCHDCHNTDELDAPAPNTPLGPHGSNFGPILRGAYPLVDLVPESPSTYELCYSCHDRELLFNQVRFPHDKHVQGQNAPCAACHDPHGSRNATHLINFMLFDEEGNTVVQPSVNTGLLEFEDTGPERGQCYLSCHSVEHDPKSY